MAVVGASAASPAGYQAVSRATLGAFGGGFAGGMTWFLATLFLGRVPLVGGYVAVLAVLVGAGAGYGALIASGRVRGPAAQIPATIVTLGLLILFQWSVVWVHLRWLQAALAEVGKTMANSVSWWDMVVEGFLGTYFFDLRVLNELGDGVGVVPGLIFWAIAIANAVAIPRRYQYAEDGR